MMPKLKVRNRPYGEKILGITASEKSAFWQAGFQVPKLFQGELMECVICKATQKSDSAVESQWRCLQDTVTKKMIYLCPACAIKSENIKRAMNHLLEFPTRMVLFQGESAREFPLNIEELKRLLDLDKKEDD
jgi:hypothetical protein